MVSRFETLRLIKIPQMMRFGAGHGQRRHRSVLAIRVHGRHSGDHRYAVGNTMRGIEINA